jgi:hypothetical protein
MQDQMTPEYKQWCPNPLKVKIAQKKPHSSHDINYHLSKRPPRAIKIRHYMGKFDTDSLQLHS